MKIGIVTFHSVNNYGAVLQAYALQTYLEARGHEVLVVDYRPRFLENRKPSLNIGSLRSIYRCLSYFQTNRTFERFRCRYLKRTRPYFSLEELRKSPPDCDVYITGSDQVWSPIVDGRNEVDLAYFLAFGSESTKRIAYAASFGVKYDNIPADFMVDLANGLSHVDSIGVREQSGVDIVRALAGKDAAWCLDPVFLLSEAAKDRITEAVHGKSAYAFVYMLTGGYALYPMVRAFARRASIRLVYEQSRVGELLGALSLTSPFSPGTWLSYLCHAQLAITSSFHGVACSIAQKRPFVYIRPSGRGNLLAERVIPLLTRLKLQTRCIREENLTAKKIEDVWRQEIDWGSVAQTLEIWRADSTKFLTNALS